MSTINWRSNALKRLFPLILLATLLLSGCTNVSQFLPSFHSQLEHVKTALHSQLERAKTLLPTPKSTDKAASDHTSAIADSPSNTSSEMVDEPTVAPVSEAVESVAPGSETELSQPTESQPTETVSTTDSSTIAPEASESTSSPASAQDMTDDTIVSPGSEPIEASDLISEVGSLQLAETTLEENFSPIIPETSEPAVSSPLSTLDENFQGTLSELDPETSLVASPEATVGITPMTIPDDAIAPPSELKELLPSEVPVVHELPFTESIETVYSTDDHSVAPLNPPPLVPEQPSTVASVETTASSSEEPVDIIATPNSTDIISTSNLPAIAAKASETPNHDSVVVEESSLQPTNLPEAERNPGETESSSQDSAL